MLKVSHVMATTLPSRTGLGSRVVAVALGGFGRQARRGCDNAGFAVPGHRCLVSEGGACMSTRRRSWSTSAASMDEELGHGHC